MENIWPAKEKKTEKEKEENVWRRKMFGEGKCLVCGGEEKWRRKRMKVFWEGIF